MILMRLHAALLVLASTAAAHLTQGLRRLHEDEQGLTTTEIAVITFMLVGAAIVVTGIIYAAAKSNADAIPVPAAPAP